jgi:hypothetical protein
LMGQRLWLFLIRTSLSSYVSLLLIIRPKLAEPLKSQSR